MTERIVEASPRLKARIAGGLWLIVIAAGMTAFLVRSPLIVRGDAAVRGTLISLIRAFDIDLLDGQSYALYPAGDGDPGPSGAALAALCPVLAGRGGRRA